MGKARAEVLRKVFPYVEVLGQKDGDSKFQARDTESLYDA